MSSAPRIVCKAGPSLSELKAVDVNEHSVHVESANFEGNIFVRLKDFKGPVGRDGKPQPGEDAPFSGDKDTWSIAFEGKFKGQIQVDDIVSRTLVCRIDAALNASLTIARAAVRQHVGQADQAVSAGSSSSNPNVPLSFRKCPLTRSLTLHDA